MVSATLSPLAAEELDAAEKPSTLPPSSSIAASKERRVRVEGSKKSVASFLYLHRSRYSSGWAIISSAWSSSLLYLLGAQVEYVYKVSHFLPPIQLSSEGSARKAMSPGTLCAGM